MITTGIRTNARRDGDDWIINGSKTYITNGWLTDTCIVVAKVENGENILHFMQDILKFWSDWFREACGARSLSVPGGC